ncbi:hypothetical protein Poli38472_008788 [Pythium oligandrum]|uniref:Uncharacterized protein n=1 Tax=Pythium oligandrum TaxID=41045 RepID=A0A8K1C479_PYTOL|nr:hypothetical protein Poli38472_008788 [Pythium oligandrum]|eukprot:TMW56140.1 hypothetical protein Poli38472_008788 [Pythium oligandrum]
MDIRRLLHNPDDGSWFVIGETKSESEMNEFRRSLKRNAIINTHLVNCTMSHDNEDAASEEHKMKVQWTKCTSALCHPKHDDEPCEPRKRRSCPVQLRMSTCQLTYKGVICQAYQHLSEEHDSAEPMQSSVTEEMKTHIIRMLDDNADVKPMVIYKELQVLHRKGEFGYDLMPTKIQLRNALTYLRSRKFKSSPRSSTSSRKRRFDSFSEGSASPSPEEHRMAE